MISQLALQATSVPGSAPVCPPGPASLHAVAAELRTMVRRIPHWNPVSDEDWAGFQRRRLATERALAARLVRLPGCEVDLSEDGWDVRLALCGLRVTSRDRLQGACLQWAQRAAG